MGVAGWSEQTQRQAVRALKIPRNSSDQDSFFLVAQTTTHTQRKSRPLWECLRALLPESWPYDVRVQRSIVGARHLSAMLSRVAHYSYLPFCVTAWYCGRHDHMLSPELIVVGARKTFTGVMCRHLAGIGLRIG